MGVVAPGRIAAVRGQRSNEGVRLGFVAILVLLLSAWDVATAADVYPSRPIRLIIPSSAGGPVDLSARLLGEYLGAKLGQPVIPENKPGALEQVALSLLANSEPDGYTLAWPSASITLLPALMKSFTWDFAKDFTPITTVVNLDTFAVVRADSPYRTLEDVVAALRASPGKLNAGSTAAWSTLQTEMFRAKTGTKFEIIRYAGNSQAIQALLSGEVDFRLATALTVKPLVDSGRLRFIAVNADKRSKWIPDIPTVAESALPELREIGTTRFYIDNWFGVMAPTNTPPEIVQVLYTAIQDVKRNPEFLKRLDNAGLFVTEPLSPAEFRALLVRSTESATKIAKDAGIKAE